mgnify:CR=1 FL=1
MTAISANTAATPGLPQLPSPPHHLQQSTHLVWSDSGYFKRNSIISTMQFLLHDGRHDRKPGRWDLGWCKLLFGALFSLFKTWFDCEVTASFFPGRPLILYWFNNILTSALSVTSMKKVSPAESNKKTIETQENFIKSINQPVNTTYCHRNMLQ